MNTQQVAQDVAQGSSMRHNTPRTDRATYPADCLGKTLVVHRDCAAALETELRKAEAELAELKAINKTGAERLQFVLTENSRLQAQLITMSVEIEEQARLLGISGNQVVALQRPLLRLTSLWHQLFFLLDITEESDSGNEFRPNYISSCRAVDAERMDKILAEAKQLINGNVKTEHL